MSKLQSTAELLAWQEEIAAAGKKPSHHIAVSAGTCGRACGAGPLFSALKKVIREAGLSDSVTLRFTGCHGFCEAEPNVIIYPEGIFYAHLKPENASDIIERTVLKGDIIPDFLYRDEDGETYTYEQEIPFYRKQQRTVMGASSQLDPTSLSDYVAHSGYTGLAKALAMEPEQVIEEVTASGLRGRGGAGFLTGKKWMFCYQATKTPKYLICNGDEGDPGAYMDRSLLEGNPHRVLEGMMIGAYAIGASRGFIYVRDEYPLAVDHIRQAIEQARAKGLLGERILGTDFSFDFRVIRGAGAFVCGEETALIHSIESKRGMPRQRPPFPAQQGLWGNPTNINNVETWANVPLIMQHGAEWFAEIGTETSKGTKVFSLVGTIRNTGLVEVPMGLSLRTLVYEIGGGIPGGKRFKAIQTGGPSGGCIPKQFLDHPVDYEKLTETGSMMGSGGMVVMDENTCMVDVARFFLEFLRDESCGKCPPCRNGIPEMLAILERITTGQSQEEDIEQLETLAKTVQDASLCGLGQTAPNPVLSTLRHFRLEYEAHIYDLTCPALVCPALIRFQVIAEKCRSCDLCRRACPTAAIEGTPKQGPYRVINEACIRCGACEDACPFAAIERLPGAQERRTLALHS